MRIKKFVFVGGGGIFAIILQSKFIFFFWAGGVGRDSSDLLPSRSAHAAYECYIWKILSKVSRVYEKFCPYILALNSSFVKTRLVIENWNNMSRRQEIKFAQPGVLKDQRYQSIRIKKCSLTRVGTGSWLGVGDGRIISIVVSPSVCQSKLSFQDLFRRGLQNSTDVNLYNEIFYMVWVLFKLFKSVYEIKARLHWVIFIARDDLEKKYINILSFKCIQICINNTAGIMLNAFLS